MAIRFQCPSCNQPIEIDDQWADRQVICPYCRKTVTAPGESSLEESPPVASPLVQQSPGSEYQENTPSGYDWRRNQSPAHPGLIPRLALGLTLISLVLIVVSNWVVASQVIKRVGPGATQKEQMEAAMNLQKEALEKMASSGEIESWLIYASMSMCLFIPCWIASFVLSILAVRSGQRRITSYISLALCSLLAFFLLSALL